MKQSLDEPAGSIFLIPFVQTFLVLGLFLSLLYNLPELTIFTLLILSLGLGAYLWSRASLNKVKLSIAFNKTRLFQGKKLQIRARIINAKILPALLKVDLFIPKAVTGPDENQWISEKAGLLWFQKTEFVKEYFPNQRGVFDLGPPGLRGADLFGFFFRQKTVKDRYEIVVYPRIVQIRPIVAHRREFFGRPGAKSPVEDPVYVYGTRDYQPGRPARGIHWKASARYNRLQEKLNEPAEREKILVILDVNGFDRGSSEAMFEKTLEAIASFVFQMDVRRTAVGFATNGALSGGGQRIIPISRNSLQASAVLEALARVKAECVGPVTDILSKGYTLPWGASAIFFARNLSEQTQTIHSYLKRRKIPVKLILAGKSSSDEALGAPTSGEIEYLDDILVPENR